MTNPTTTTPDVEVSNEGSVILFYPRTDAAWDFIQETFVIESWQWLGKAFAVDHRVAPNVVQLLENGGLEVDY